MGETVVPPVSVAEANSLGDEAFLKRDLSGSCPGFFLSPPGVLTAAMRWVPVHSASNPYGGITPGVFGRTLNRFGNVDGRDGDSDRDSEDGRCSVRSHEDPTTAEPSASSTSSASYREAASSTTPTLTASSATAESVSSQDSVSEVTFSPRSAPSSPRRDALLLDSEFAEWTLLHMDPSRSSPDSPSAKTWGTITQEALSSLGNA
eukprot:TRINITY_DN112726_c0_g1_i1.p1 TRINITY_DN112726_c0_g1~~TRINITY_DN112726_c0_g1_i1.p1  ORF type:complete len:226 (+),score=34.18 TRINITY_DN112726_c0_g1_i1:65-679(+)